jgi:hypothetical protein
METMTTTMLSKKKKKNNTRDNDSSLLLLLLLPLLSRLLSSSKRRGWLTPSPFKADISISLQSVGGLLSSEGYFSPSKTQGKKNRLFKVSYDTLNDTLNFTLSSFLSLSFFLLSLLVLDAFVV